MSEGKSAHWGVIRGFAVQCHDAHSRLVAATNAAVARGGAEAGEAGEAGGGVGAYEYEYGSEGMVLLVSHGVSARPFACSYEELAASNAQLDDWVPTEEVRSVAFCCVALREGGRSATSHQPPATRHPPPTSHPLPLHHPPIKLVPTVVSPTHPIQITAHCQGSCAVHAAQQR